MIMRKRLTLILVDSPSKMTGYNTLKKAQKLRRDFMDGWDKVVILDWNFVTDIGKILDNIKDDTSLDALPLDQKNKEKLEKVMVDDPLVLIEYWSIDPDYDGETFRSKWQDYRQNTETNSDSFRVVKQTKLDVPKIKGKRKVCVKTVDVFFYR